MSRIVLHICCAPCATHCIEILRPEGEVLGLFLNPNIQPLEEYRKRLEEVRRLSRKLDFELIEVDYDIESWNDAIRGLEEEPEGGRRCEECFRIRLEQAAKTAAREECDSLTTTLTISPHKNSALIHKIGEEAVKPYDIVFREDNFKKADGFRRSLELSKKHDLYRQNYCGCIFSQRTKGNKK